jgi:hypothetical protein
VEAHRQTDMMELRGAFLWLFLLLNVSQGWYLETCAAEHNWQCAQCKESSATSVNSSSKAASYKHKEGTGITAVQSSLLDLLGLKFVRTVFKKSILSYCHVDITSALHKLTIQFSYGK